MLTPKKTSPTSRGSLTVKLSAGSNGFFNIGIEHTCDTGADPDRDYENARDRMLRWHRDCVAAFTAAQEDE